MKIRTALNKIKHHITIFDIVFISLGIIAVLGFYLFFKREVVSIIVRYKITDENVLYATTNPRNEYASAYTVGDAERDELGRIKSEIVRVDSYKTSPDASVVYLDIKVKTVYNPRTRTYSLNGKNIIFGESFDFSFSKARVKGLVVDFPGFNDSASTKTSKTTVKAQLRYSDRSFSDVYGVPDFLATAVQKGDVVKDSEGNILVKITDVTLQPAKRLVVNSTGQPFIVDDPYLKDVFYTIELTTYKVNEKEYIFDYIPVLLGAVIPINLNTVTVFPTITEIVK